ncbi:hypothetical protein KY290_013054 [Solanum tuberosum]|uniref:Integrase catalytic domain-containing protein n=1 Tax=Solanum tuberosum TaxID=4113 RepID=A0ABQ7VKZ7_SOLTU|nr:hypothetical protein KY285_015133 [Solanum tuberosum]KAH0769073.1 hypothetical protein KY290_013054 [Solanum tuberosum]
MAFLARGFKKYLRKGKENEKKETNQKRWINDKSQNGYYKCGKTDHHVKDCPQWEANWRKERIEKERNSKKKEEYAMVGSWGLGNGESDDAEINETTLMALGDSDAEDDENFEVKVKGSKHWYIDSACSKHMTGDKHKFLSLTAFKGGNVSFGVGKKGTIIGVGKIGKTESKALEEVYHVDGVEKLDAKEVILTTKRHRNVYKTDITGMPSTTLKCLSAIANDPLLWHKRLGHASLKQINKLLEKEMGEASEIIIHTKKSDHNFSAPRTPQQNGVVERKNRTLEDMARTMMIANNLEKNRWAKAISTACYITNRCMTRPILEKTPY